MRYILSAVYALFGVSILLTAAAITAAAEVKPPALIRGVMTDDVKTLQEVGANSCLLWGPPGKAEAWDKLTQAGLFPFLGSLGGDNKELFDYEGKKRVRMRVPYCYSAEWGHWWVGNVAASADKHYPAICCVTPDECAWNNGVIPYFFGIRQEVGARFYCDCAQCRKSAGELPPLTASRFLADSDAARRYILYRYQAVADAFRASMDKVRQKDPSYLSYFTLNLHEVMALERYPTGIALDRLPSTDILLATCFQTSVDRRGDESRFVQPMVVKHLLAGRPRLGAVPCLAATVYNYREKFDWTEAYYWRKDVEDLLPKAVLDPIAKDLQPYTLRDDEVILPALSCIANGAKGVMFFGDDQKAALKKTFTLMTALEKSLAGAAVPGEVVVLCSRQSEDEWMLTHAPSVGSRDDLTDAMVQAGCWAQPADRIAWEFNRNAPHALGFRSTQAAMQALMRLGIPFRLHFVENLQASDLALAKVVVVPFCTHIPDAAAAAMRAFPAKGKLIVFAHRGEFDPSGKRREKPALAADAGVAFFEAEAADALRDAAGRQKLADAIGDVFAVRLASDSDSVERTWLRLADGGIASFAINWGDKGAAVRIRLPGAGKATLIDTSGKSSEPAVNETIVVPGRDARILVRLVR